MPYCNEEQQIRDTFVKDYEKMTKEQLIDELIKFHIATEIYTK